jgi:hypothetical protein
MYHRHIVCLHNLTGILSWNAERFFIPDSQIRSLLWVLKYQVLYQFTLLLLVSSCFMEQETKYILLQTFGKEQCWRLNSLQERCTDILSQILKVFTYIYQTSSPASERRDWRDDLSVFPWNWGTFEASYWSYLKEVLSQGTPFPRIHLGWMDICYKEGDNVYLATPVGTMKSLASKEYRTIHF